MKHIAYFTGLVLSGLASTSFAENRIENMVMVGEIASVGTEDVTVLPTSPVPYLYPHGDVNSLNSNYIASLDEINGQSMIKSKDSRGEFTRLHMFVNGVNKAAQELRENYRDGGTSTLAGSSYYTDHPVSSFKTHANNLSGIRTFGVYPTFGKYSHTNIALDGLEDVDAVSLYSWDRNNRFIPSEYFRAWVMKGDVVIEDGSKPLIFTQIGKFTLWDRKQNDFADFETIHGGSGLHGGAKLTSSEKRQFDYVGHCDMAMYLDGKKITSSDTREHPSGKISLKKTIFDLEEGRHSLVGIWTCKVGGTQVHHSYNKKVYTINNRIDTMKIGVVDVENRSVLPVSTFKLPERVEPKIGNLPALHTVQRLGRNNWTGWAPEKLNLTDLDLIKDEHQEYGLSNLRHVKQYLVEDTFYPKSEGTYQFYFETESNTCIDVAELYGVPYCLYISHPSYIMALNNSTIIAAEPSIQSPVPSRNNFGSFFATKNDVEYGVDFVFSARGRLPWKNTEGNKDIFMADLEGDYNAPLQLDGDTIRRKSVGDFDRRVAMAKKGQRIRGYYTPNTIPAAVRVTNALAGASVQQKVRVWIKGPTDTKFRPFYDYDFKKGDE